jgi:hypothetical protein
MGRHYIPVVMLIALLGAPLYHVAEASWRFAACRPLARPGAYLAYCDSPTYGSYEQAAYWYDLEPEATRSLQQADILFLGNSRLQFAFSTQPVDDFFSARSLRYHLLGFGYGESSRFPRALLRRYRPTPKLVIINADPFFQDVPSPVAADIERDPSRTLLDGLDKLIFDRLQPALCAIPLFCSATNPSTYRDRRSGQWIWRDILAPAATVAGPITPAKPIPWSRQSLPAWQADAETFLDELGVPRSCIILTGIPTPAIDAEGMATALAKRLGVTVIIPAIDGLTALDTSHLSAASADRWSTAFLAAAAPTIDACLPRLDARLSVTASPTQP